MLALISDIEVANSPMNVRLSKSFEESKTVN